MHWADARGLKDVFARLTELARQTGDESLAPAPLLARLVAEDRGFASLR
jgi:3-hydroxyacyl-CoA dehydrogenase